MTRLLRMVVALSGVLAAAVMPPLASAQETDAAPASGGWSWSSRFDVGWRGLDLEGSEGSWRTIVDDGDGVRGFALSVDASRGVERGRWADTFTVRGKGFGGDDDQAFRLTLGRRGSYRVVLDATRTKGFFGVPDWQRGQHASDRVREAAGVEITLYPKRAVAWLSFRTRGLEGPGTTTQAQGSNQFLLTDERDARSEDLRVGGRIPIGPVTLTLEQAFRSTDEVDEMALAEGAESGNQGNVTLGAYSRRIDSSSSTSVSRIALQVPFKSRADLSLSFLRADGDGEEVARRDSFQVRPAPPSGIERLLDSEASLDRVAELVEAGLTLKLSERLSLEDTFRLREADSDGDVDQVATSIIGVNETVTESAQSLRYEERSRQNSLGLAWRGPRGVVVRGGFRTGRRELTWGDDAAGETSSAFDEERIFAAASWRPGPKVHLAATLERANNDADGDDPKLLTRTLLQDSWEGSVKLILAPRSGTTVGLTLGIGDGENDAPRGTRSDQWTSISASVTHAFGDAASLRAIVARTSHDSDTALAFHADGAPVASIHEYRLDNTAIRLEVNVRPKARVGARFLARWSETDGTRPTTWYRLEPRLFVRATDRLGFDVGWYRERYDRPSPSQEGFTAEGIMAWMRWSLGGGSEARAAGGGMN